MFICSSRSLSWHKTDMGVMKVVYQALDEKSQKFLSRLLTLAQSCISFFFSHQRQQRHGGLPSSYQQHYSNRTPHLSPRLQHRKVSTLSCRGVGRASGASKSRQSRAVSREGVIGAGWSEVHPIISIIHLTFYIPYSKQGQVYIRIRHKHYQNQPARPPMRNQEQNLDRLLKRVSIRINKSPEELQPFFDILRSNWFDTEESLQKLTVADYERMKIPLRVAQAVGEELAGRQGQQAQVQQGGSGGKVVLNQSTMLALADRLSLGLLKSLDENRYETRSIIEIIYKIVANIVKDPYEMKYRTLKKSNNLILKNIVSQPPCLDFIKAIGFEEKEQTLELAKFQVPQLIFLEDCLNDIVVQLGGSSLQQQQPRTAKQQHMFLNVTKFPENEGQIQEQFSQDKLAEMKYVDALEKLVQFRHSLMSQAPSDRRLRIYHKRLEEKALNVQQVSFDQEFQKSDDKAVLSYWKEIVSANNRAQKFQSKRKLEFDFLVKQKVYRETLIKVKLPNELIIEAYFGPMEQLSAVFELVTKVVVGDLYMFTAPPRKVMDKKEMAKTLMELEAVPTGSFYLAATDNVYYIVQPYANNIRM